MPRQHVSGPWLTIADIKFPLDRHLSQIIQALSIMAFFLTNTGLSYGKDSLRIAYYHIVASHSLDYYFDNKIISPGIFRKHLSFFSSRFEIVTLNDAIKRAENGESLERKLVLTFDDGFSENYTVIAPILKEVGCRATFFLIGNCIDNKDLMWRNKLIVVKRKNSGALPYLIASATRIFSLPAISYHEDILKWSLRTWPMSRKDEIANYFWNSAAIGPIEEYLDVHKPYLTTKEINCLLNEGFEIGSHSLSHPDFSKLSYEEFRHEILDAVNSLQTRFNTEINSFSYPFGRKSTDGFEQQLLNETGIPVKTFLGTKNRLGNYQDCLQWQRDNLEFPMDKMLFRFKVLPILRKLSNFK